MMAVAVVPVIAMIVTSESPAIRPPPSHATPENVSRVASTPSSLDFECTDNRMNSSPGVTDRHIPVNVLGGGACDTVSGGEPADTGSDVREHPATADSKTTTDIQRMFASGSAPVVIPAETHGGHARKHRLVIVGRTVQRPE